MSDKILIEWTGIGLKHIATPAGNVSMIPRAVTPVPVAVWEIARPWFSDVVVPKGSSLSDKDKDIGRFIEHTAKVEVETVEAKKGPGGKVIEDAKVSVKITDAKDIGELPDSEAREYVAKIADIEVLNSYLNDPKLDGKPIKGAVERRLKEIEEKANKRKAK